jgi:hypothetical protein
MDPSAETRIRELLDPGEELLWAGSPRQGLRIDQSGTSFVLFLVVLCTPLLIAILIRALIIREFPGGLIFVGFFLMLALAGLRAFLSDVYERRNVTYGLTPQWAIIVGRNRREKTRRFPIASIRSMSVHRLGDGVATIVCALDAEGWPRDSASGKLLSRPLFRYIDDPANLYAQMTALRPDLRSDHEMLSADDEAYLRRLLQPDERLLWWERPPGGLRGRGNDALQALMALVMIIAPIVCIKAVIDTRDARRESIGEISGGATAFIAIAGTLLMLKGLHLLVVRYFQDARSRNSLLYALTDQRAISAKHPNEYGTSVRSISLDSITDLDIAWEPDGRGTVSCHGEALDWTIPNASHGSFLKHRVKGPLFRSIASPERVSAMMPGSKAAPSKPTPQTVHTGSSIGAVTERLRGETIRWAGTSDDPGKKDRITAWFVQFLRWTKGQLELLGVMDKVVCRLTSVLRSAPILRTRRLAYMLTERRVVIIDRAPGHGAFRIPLNSLDKLFLQTDRHGKRTIFGRSSVRDWPYRYPASKPVAGPLFPGVDTSEVVVSMMSAAYPGLEQDSQEVAASAADRQIRNWLLDGETLIWSGRPLPDRPITRFDFWCFLLLIGYALVAGALVVQAYQRQPHFSGVIGAIPTFLWGSIATGASLLLAYGLYRTYLRYLIDPHTWRSTVYGLTDRRAIVQTDRWIQSIPFQRLGHVEIDSQGSRKGSLKCRFCGATWQVFEELSVRCERAWPFDGYLFKDIRDPEEVAAVIATTRASVDVK